MKATEQHFPVVLFIILYKVVLNFEFLDEITEQYVLVAPLKFGRGKLQILNSVFLGGKVSVK